MPKYLLILAFSVASLAQEFKVERIASAPAGLPDAYAAAIDAAGYRVVGPKGPWCEIWFRKTIPTGAKSGDPSIAFPIAQGTLVGVMRFPSGGADRRDQQVKAGVYTIRYSNFRVDGAHQGAAPQRDFALLTPIGNDADPGALPDWQKLVEMSRTSGTAHPAVFSLQPPAATTFPSVTKQGEEDMVLNVKVGDLPLAIIVVGKAEG